MTKGRYLLIGLLVMASLLYVEQAGAVGRAQVLSDAELDGTYAQGLFIVNISMNLNRLADRFDFGFVAEARINVPDVPNGGLPSQARLDFLGSLVSIATTPVADGSQATAPSTSATTAMFANGGLAVSVESVGSGRTTTPASPSATATGSGADSGATRFGASDTRSPPIAPPGSGVSVSFAGGGTGLGRNLVSISAVNVTVDTRINITVGPSLSGLGAAIRSAVQTQIRNSLGARP